MNNFNIIRKLRERFNNFYPVYHAPLVFDIHTQTCSRKAGYVSWPKTQNSVSKGKEDEQRREMRTLDRAYFAYPTK